MERFPVYDLEMLKPARCQQQRGSIMYGICGLSRQLSLVDGFWAHFDSLQPAASNRQISLKN